MSKGKSWAMFLVGLVLCTAALFSVPQYSWIPLPFLLTGLAQILDAI
jgi:hypothetical protein